MFGLNMNVEKSKIVSNAPGFRKVDRVKPIYIPNVDGVEVVDAHRYLGWTFNCNKLENKQAAKNYIMKMSKLVHNSWKFKNAEINRDAHTWFVSSLFVYMLPPLMAVDACSEEDFRKWYAQALRKSYYFDHTIANKWIYKYNSYNKKDIY